MANRLVQYDGTSVHPVGSIMWAMDNSIGVRILVSWASAMTGIAIAFLTR